MQRAGGRAATETATGFKKGIRLGGPIQLIGRNRSDAVQPFYDYGTVATEDRLSKCSGRPSGLCGRLPELNLIPIQIIDPGKATVGFIHSFGINLYPLLF